MKPYRIPITLLLLGLTWALARYLGLFGRHSHWATAGHSFVPQYAFSVGTALGLAVVTAVLIRGAMPREGGGEGPLLPLAYSGVPVAVLGLLQYAGGLRGLFPVYPGYDQRIYSVFGNQDLFGGYLASTISLLSALTLARRGPWRFAAPAGALMFMGLAVSGSRTAWAAAAVGAGVALAMYRPPRRVWGAIALCVALLIAACITFAPDATFGRVARTFGEDDTGYRVRLWVWDGTARMIAEHPIAGVGLGNYRYFSPRYLGQAIHARGPGGHASNALETHHAHSDLLEILAETGIIGAALVLLFVVRLQRVASPAWALMAAGLTFSIANTTLHSPPHVLAMLLCAGELMPTRQSTERAGGVTRRGLRLAAVVGMATLVIATTVAPSFLMTRAESAFAGESMEEARRAYANAIRGPGSAGEACYALAVLAANDARYREAEFLMGCALRWVDTAQTHYVAGFIAEQLWNNSDAATHYEASVARQPDLARAWERLVAVSDEATQDAVVARAAPWLTPEENARLTTQRERVRTAPVRREDAADR